jgi:hypothetical protein
LFFDRPHCYANNTACVGPHQNAAGNNNLSASFSIGSWASSIGSWAESNHDAIEALSAVGVLALTAVLAFSTMFLWMATNAQGNLTQQSIDLARDEFRSTHRPKIRVKHFVLNSDIWHDEPLNVNMTCVNTGPTDAFLGDIGLTYFVVRKRQLIPIEPDIPTVLRGNGVRPVSGKNLVIPDIRGGTVLTEAQNVGIQDGSHLLYCVGYVSYFDAAMCTRITGFCRVLSCPKGILAHKDNCRFRVYEDRDYEYQD